MGNTEKKIVGGLGLALLGLGTAGIGPLAGIFGSAAAGATGAAAGAGGTGIGATLAGLGKTAVGSALGTGLSAEVMKSMRPDVTTPLQMPQVPQQPDIMALFKMFGNQGGM